MRPYFSNLSALPPVSRTAAFTGHRSGSVPWLNEPDSERFARCIKELDAACLQAVDSGKRWFLSGMADGFDRIAAERILNMKKELPDIGLICVFPYRSAGSIHSELAEQADGCIILLAEYASGCMHLRNRFLVQNSSLLIAGYDGRAEGGTFDTVRSAIDIGRPVKLIRL